MESFVSILEAALRGGAAAILLLLAALLLRDAGRTPAGRNLVLYLLSAAGYAVCSAPGLASLDHPLAIALLIVSLGAPALFWTSAAAVFDDGFRPKWYRGLAWLGLVALGLWSMFDARPFAGFAYYALSLLFVGLAARHALTGWDSDLLEGRRLRILVAVATALYAAAIIVVDVLSPGSSVSARFSIFNAAGLVAMTFAGAMAWMGLVRRAPVAPASGDARSSTRAQAGNAAPPAQPDDGPEMALLAALRRLMDEQKLYRQDRLNLAALAGRLGIPEYRLRRLINRRLGHRNFRSFINGYRLAEARAALADPRQVRVPIVTIALDTGFQSLAPFNRAFKTAAGMTPSQYRRQCLSRFAPNCAI